MDVTAAVSATTFRTNCCDLWHMSGSSGLIRRLVPPEFPSVLKFLSLICLRILCVESIAFPVP